MVLQDNGTGTNSVPEYFDWEEDHAGLILSIVDNELGSFGSKPTFWEFRNAWIGRGKSQLNIDRILAHLGVVNHFNHAGFVSMSVPSPMIAGQSYPVQVVMQNNGSTTWSSANAYSLGSQSAQDNTTWGMHPESSPHLDKPKSLTEHRLCANQLREAFHERPQQRLGHHG